MLKQIFKAFAIVEEAEDREKISFNTIKRKETLDIREKRRQSQNYNLKF